MAEAASPGVWAGLVARARRHVPNREALAGNRWVRPFAPLVLRPELWRLNRRSVPRGVALGLFVGIAVPFMHTFLAPIAAVFVRANVPVSIGVTWLSNPLTWPVMWWTAWRIGHSLLRLDRMIGLEPLGARLNGAASLGGHHHGLHGLAGQGLATVGGLVIEAALVSALGYLLTTLFWRLRTARKWRARGTSANLPE